MLEQRFAETSLVPPAFLRECCGLFMIGYPSVYVVELEMTISALRKVFGIVFSFALENETKFCNRLLMITAIRTLGATYNSSVVVFKRIAVVLEVVEIARLFLELGMVLEEGSFGRKKKVSLENFRRKCSLIKGPGSIMFVNESLLTPMRNFFFRLNLLPSGAVQT